MTLLTTFFTFWGFFAHEKINNQATFLLPDEMYGFFKLNINEIRSGAVRPDQRRRMVEKEDLKHYIDVELYPDILFNEPIQFDDALLLFGDSLMNKAGIAPWNINVYYYKLRNAFEKQDARLILKYAGEVGHYIADLHVPLHTTENYNGQLTDQIGIHAFWESSLPEKFSKEYFFPQTELYYIYDVLGFSWEIMKESHSLVNQVLESEKKISKPSENLKKMVLKRRGHSIQIQPSDEYAKQYHEILNGMVENRMQLAIYRIASFWYSCWIDAGQPDLNDLKVKKSKKRKYKGKNVKSRHVQK